MRPLLPGTWPQVNWQVGLQQISPQHFEGNFYNKADVRHFGIPSLFARPFAFTKALESNNKTTIKYFNLLIKGIFLGIIEVKEYTFPEVDIKLTGVMRQFPPFIDSPGLDKFYVLKWRGKPIGGVYHSCFVYPGAKFQIASEWNRQEQNESPEPEYVNDAGLDITFQSLETVITRKMKLYGTEFVKSLYGLWIKEKVESKLAVDGKLLGRRWFDRLLDISNGDWDTDLKLDKANLFSQYIKEKKIKFELNGNIVKIPICSIDKEKSVFVDKLIKFGADRYPDYPVKSEYIDRIVDCKLKLHESKDNWPEYQIKLKEWNKSFAWSPLRQNILNTSSVSLLLWPNFKIDFKTPQKEWKVNYICFSKGEKDDIEETDVIKKPFRIDFFKDSNSGIIESVDIGKRRTHSKILGFQVEFAEIVCGNIQQGIFKDKRKQIDDPQNANLATTISIDFGTTNTSIGYYNRAEQEEDCLIFKDISYDLFETNYWWSEKNKRTREESRFLPTAFSKEPIGSFPSELLFNSEEDKNSGNDSLEFPLERFTIPHPYFKRKDETNKILIANFKWEAPANLGFDKDRLTNAYFKILLHLVLGRLISDTPYARINIIPTYPLAFGGFQYNVFKKTLEGIFREVSNETGLNLSLATVNTGVQELVSETAAARVYSSTMRKDDRAEFVVDIGGGTTDIAMWVKTKQGEKEIIDSIKYGANIYLNRLTEEMGLPDGYNINNVAGVNQTIEVQKMIRSSPNGIQHVLAAYGARQIDRVLKQGIRDFFDGLFFYLFKILSRYEFNQADFYPVGNGWRLLDGVGITVGEFVKQQFQGKKILVEVIPPLKNDFKGAVSKGAKKIGDEQNYEHPVNIEVNTIMGGTINIRINEEEKTINWVEKVPTAALGPGPSLNIIPVDFIKEVLTELKRDNILKTESRVMNLSQDLNNKMNNAVKELDNRQVGLSKGVVSVFLEEVYKGLIMSN